MPKFKKEPQKRELQEVTTELGEAYDLWKDSEELKDEFKNEFFSLATEESKNFLAKKAVSIVAKDAAEAEFLVARQNPRWTVETVKKVAKKFNVLLIENPEFKEFVFENREVQRTFKRQVQDGSAQLDDEMLRKENPELWLEVSEVPNLSILESIIDPWLINQTNWETTFDYIEGEWPVAQRRLKPFAEMSPKQIAALDRYIFQGKPVVKFPKPSNIKDESGE